MQVQMAQGQQPTVALSDSIIPAVRGEFYSYSTQFTVDRPLGFLMKCRANKGRPMTDAENYAHEHDLTFIFENGGVIVCSPNSAPSIRLLSDLDISGELNQTWITTSSITKDAFNELRQRRSGIALARACLASASRNDGIITLALGTMLDVTTESGKYGLILVTEITPTSISVDACHILL